MAGMKKVLSYGAVGLAGALLVWMWASIPDDSTSGIESTGPEAPSPDLSAAANNQASPPRDQADNSVHTSSKGVGQLEIATPEVKSLEEHMADPDARAESYLLAEGALQTGRLEELSRPATFDAFLTRLGEGASAESQAMAASLLQEFYTASNQLNGSITVTDLSCGAVVCAAKFQASDSSMLNEYLASLMSSP